MAKINTLNYQTVAAWNGSQDLFVVEQPDGTKVATPAMVKQFIEAGDFEATGEVKDGHGNILKDMAKSADVNNVIGDLSQTGLTGDSVADQLATANTAIGERAIRVKANTSNTKQFTFPRSIWADNGMTSSSSHTALFSGGYNNRISAGLVATNGTGVSVIKLGDNTVTATISGNNIELAFNDTVYTDLYLILLN